MLNEGVLRRTGTKYQLSEEWIKRKKGEISNIEANYFQGEVNFSLPQQNLVFDSIFDVDKFLIGSFVSISSQLKQKPVLCLHWSHFWVPLFFSRKEYSQLKDFAKFVKAYCISRGNTAIDKWCASFWNKQGWKHKLGANVAATADIVIFGDYVIQVFYPTEIRCLLEDVYSKTKNVSSLDMDYFFHKVFEKKAKIPVIVLKNQGLAEELKKQTKAFFRQ